MRRSTTLTIVFGVAVVAIGFFVLTQNSFKREGANSRGASSGTTITLGYHPNVVIDLPLVYAIQRGDFAKQGFDVDLKPYGRPDLILAAMKSGEIQGSLGVALELLLAQAANGSYPARGYLVWELNATQGFDGLIVRANSDVRSLDDLRGKVVGVYPSPQLQYFVSRFLPSSTIRTYNPDAPFTALDSGDMAAEYVKEPFIAVARTRPDKYRILELNSISRQVFGGASVPAAVSILSAAWMDAHQKEAAKFVRLARQAYFEYAGKRTIYNTLTQPAFGGFSPEVSLRVVEPAASFPEALSQSDLQRYVRTLEEGALISGDIAFDRLLYVPPAQ